MCLLQHLDGDLIVYSCSYVAALGGGRPRAPRALTGQPELTAMSSGGLVMEDQHRTLAGRLVMGPWAMI